MPHVVIKKDSSGSVQNWVHGYLSHVRRYHAPLLVIWSSTNGHGVLILCHRAVDHVSFSCSLARVMIWQFKPNDQIKNHLKNNYVSNVPYMHFM